MSIALLKLAGGEQLLKIPKTLSFHLKKAFVYTIATPRQVAKANSTIWGWTQTKPNLADKML